MSKLRNFGVGEIYHIIKRGVDKRKTFMKNQDYSRFILSLEFFNNVENIDLWNLFKKYNRKYKKEFSIAPNSHEEHSHLQCSPIEHPEKDTFPAEGARGALRRIEDEASDFSLIQELEELRENQGKPIVELLTFTLMPNHYHLLIREITEGGITSFMHKLGGYSQYFNQQYNRSGSLFEPRYKCIKIKNEKQLKVVFNYIHFNQLELIEPGWKGGEVKNLKEAIKFLEEYLWSSYRDYIGIETYPRVIKKDLFLDLFSGEKDYKKAIEDWVKFKTGDSFESDNYNSVAFE